MAFAHQYTVFYDGGCGFCDRCVRLLDALDWLRRFRYATLQGEEARGLGITGSGIPEEMVVRKAGAETPEWRGWKAVKAAIFRVPVFYLALGGSALLSPWLALAVLAAFSPLGNPAGQAFYRWVARNRYRLPGSSCSLENR